MEVNIKQSIAVLLAHNNPDERRMAAEGLSGFNELAPIAALAAALQDPNKGVRDAAYRSLVNIGGTKVSRAVVEYIGDENITTRNLVADLLCRIGEPAIPALIPYVHDTDHDVRKFAVDIIGLIGSYEAVSDLILLLTDGDMNVLLAAVEALGNIGHQDALNPLYETYEKYPEARPSVAEALGKIGDPQACNYLLRILDEELSRNHNDCLTEFAIVESLGIVGNEHALDVLRKRLPYTKGKLANAIIHSMVQIYERLDRRVYLCRGDIERLIDALFDDDVDVCISAVKGLERFTNDEVTLVLIRALGKFTALDSYLYPILLNRDNVFGSVFSLLGEKDINKKALLLLIGRMTQMSIVSMFRNGAGKIDNSLLRKAFDNIAGEWENADEEMRAVIVDVLFSLDGDRAVLFLDKILNDQDPWLRIHVIEILVSISDPRSPEYLSQFLNDDEEVVREVATAALQAKGYSLT